MPELARRQVAHYGVRFEVRRNTNWPGLFERIRARGQWPSDNARYCTSEMKTGVGMKFVTEVVARLGLDRPARVLYALGLRAEESRSRAKKPPLHVNTAKSSRNRTITMWNPVLDQTEAQIWDRIRASGVPHHWAYDAGMRRLSCSLCPLAGAADLACAAGLRPRLAAEYADLEQAMGVPFKRGLPLAQIVAGQSRSTSTVH